MLFKDISVIITTAITLLALISTLVSMYTKVNVKTIKNEKDEIEKDIHNIKETFYKGEENVLDLMLKNVSELREYYTISKIHANRSFTFAILMSIIGVGIYLTGIIVVIILKVDVMIISIIAGTVLELISGLSFWLYSKSIKQLSIYHNRLVSTEKYLTAMQLVEKVPEANKYEEYRNIINYILNDNRTELQRVTNVDK